MSSRHVAPAAAATDVGVVEGLVRSYLGGARVGSGVASGAADCLVTWLRPAPRQVVVEFRGLHIVLDPAKSVTEPAEPAEPAELVQADAPPSAELAAWAESLVLADASDGETLGLLRASQRLIGWATARQVDAVAELCARRVQPAERVLGAALAAGNVLDCGSASRRLDMAQRAVIDEIALELACTRWLADRLVTTALALTGFFAATLDALRAGRLDPRKAEAIAVGLADLQDPVLRRHAERLALEVAPELNVPTLRERIKQAVLGVQPIGAAEAAARARGQRRVVFSPVDDDMMELRAFLPADDGARVRAVLDRAADRARHRGDPRTADQRRLDTLVDAITGLEGDVDPGSDPSAQAQPQKAPPESASDALPDGPPDTPPDTPPDIPPDTPPDTPAGAAPTPGSGGLLDATGADRVGLELAPARHGRRRLPGPHYQVVLTVPLSTVTGDGDNPGHLSGYGPVSADLARQMAWSVADEGTWRCAVVDDRHGTLLGLGVSTFTPSYQATVALGRHVMTRDQVCRFPGCRARAVRCDIDHRVPWPGGPSCECNDEALCGHHHRIKHETGFRVRKSDDPAEPPGTLIWTTPGGRDYLDRPARLGPPPF